MLTSDTNPFESPWPNRIAAFAVGMAFAFMLYLGATNYQLAKQGAETHTAVCTLKQDLITRRADGVKFLRDNPQGIPGISREQILDSLAKQKATIDSLSALHC